MSKNNMRGITLVETIIYTALIGIVLTGFMALAMSVSELWIKQTVQGSVNSNIEQIQMILAEQINSATKVIYPLAGTASTSLALEFDDSQEIIFEVKNFRLIAKLDSGEEFNLSDATIAVSGFNINNIGTSGVDDSFRISAIVAYLASSSQKFNFSAPLLIAITKINEEY